MTADVVVTPTGVIPTWRVPDKLRKAREYAGLSQIELAERTGISRASIVNYESGRYRPRRPALIAWALATGVDAKWLAADEPITGRFLVRVQAQERATPAAATLRRRAPRLPESLSA